MEFFEVLENRRSIRSYTPEVIEKEKLEKILAAINCAPSAGNLQAYEVVLIRDAKQKKKIAEACLGQNFVSEGSVILVFCANLSASSSRYGSRGIGLYAIQDATIACTYAQLACTAQGLSSCWIGAFNEKKVAEAINAPKEVKIIAVLPIGYPAKAPVKTSRREIGELVREEKF